MQIGIRLHDTKKGTLEERVAIAEEQGFSSGSICLVLASHGFEEADYIRSYDEFLNNKNIL